MRRTVIIYGLLGGLLILGLKLIEYRFLVVEHSLEIYGGLVAARRTQAVQIAKAQGLIA